MEVGPAQLEAHLQGGRVEAPRVAKRRLLHQVVGVRGFVVDVPLELRGRLRVGRRAVDVQPLCHLQVVPCLYLHCKPLSNCVFKRRNNRGFETRFETIFHLIFG